MNKGKQGVLIYGLILFLLFFSAAFSHAAAPTSTPTSTPYIVVTTASPWADQLSTFLDNLLMAFSDTTVDTSSTAMTLTIANNSENVDSNIAEDLNVSSIAVAGSFTFDSGTCGSTPFTLSSQADCTLAVTFTPADVGPNAGTIQILSDDGLGDEDLTLDLTGTGTQAAAPSIAVSGAVVFSPTTVGDTSASETVIITNNGNATLNVDTVAITGTNPGDFTIPSGGTCGSAPFTVASGGGNCTVPVAFSPGNTGPKTANFTINSNDSGSPMYVALSGTATVVSLPSIAVTGPGAFADTIENESSTPATVTIANNGDAALEVSNIEITGTDSGDFALDTTGCAGTAPDIAAGANCTVAVTFSPSLEGAKSATLVITSNDSGSPENVALNATAIAAQPIIGGTDTVPDFGNVVENQSSSAFTVNISNSGNVDLLVDSIAITGTDSVDFTLDLNGGGTPCGSAAPTVAKEGGSCTVNVAFSPTSMGGKTAALSIESNDSASPKDIALSGTGLQSGVPNIAVTDIGFVGSIIVNLSSSPVTVTISNTGDEALNVSGISITGADSGEFDLDLSGVGACLVADPTLASGINCTVTVTFSPISDGAKTAALTVTSDDPDSATLDVAISGTGIVAQADIAVTGSGAFADTTETLDSDPETITIANNGNIDLTVTGIAVTGTDSADFDLDASGCGSVIVPAGNCSVTVTFSPAAVGVKSAGLEIDSNDPDSPKVTVALSGTAVEVQPDIAVTGSGAFANTTEGVSSSPSTVTIANNGTMDLTVSGIAITGTDSGDFTLDTTGCAGTSPSIAAGANCTVTVTFSPGSEGAKSAALEIDSDDADSGKVTVALSGTALTAMLNNLPTIPALVYPTAGQFGLPTSIDFEWEKSSDPDGDNVTYAIKVCDNDQFTGDCIDEINIASMKGNLYFAGTGAGLLLFGTVFAGCIRSKKKMALLLSILMIAAMLSVSCGSSDNSEFVSSDNVTQTVSGLDTGTTYYWKVVSDDGNGGVTESEVRSFTTE